MKRVMLLSVCCLLAQAGCQSTERMSWFGRSSASDEDVRRALASATEKPGLPPPSQTQAAPRETASAQSVDQHLALGQQEVAEWYQDHQEYHLAAAKMHFDDVVARNPANSRAHHGLAIIADLKHDYAEAERHYQLALSQTPNDSNLLGDLGYSYLLQNRLSDAEKYLLRSVQADESNRNATKHLGDVYARQGRTTQAEQTYAKVLNAEETRAALAENSSKSDNAPQAASAATAQSNSSDSIFDKLMPGRKNGEKITSDIQKKLEAQRQSQDTRAWTGNVAAANSHRDMAAENVQLRDRLAAIDREGYPAATQGPIYVDGRNGMASQPANPGMAPAWPPNDAQPPQQVRYESAPGNPMWPQGGIQQAGGTVNGQPNPAPGSNPGPWSGADPAQGYSGGDAHHLPYHGSNPVQRSLVPPDPNASQFGAGRPHPSMSLPPEMQTRSSVTPSLPGQDPFAEASRSAARLGMGMGPDAPFPTVTSAPEINGPGTGSHWNGDDYRQPHRMLPTNLPPLDLSQAYQPNPTPTPSPGNHPGTAGQPNVAPMYSQEQFGTASRYDARTLQSSDVPPAGHMDPRLQSYELQRQESNRQLNQSLQQVWGQGQMNNMVSPAAGTTFTPPPSDLNSSYPMYRPQPFGSQPQGSPAASSPVQANGGLQSSSTLQNSGYVEPPPYRPDPNRPGSGGASAIAPAFPQGGNFQGSSNAGGDSLRSLPNQYGSPSSMPLIIPGDPNM